MSIHAPLQIRYTSTERGYFLSCQFSHAKVCVPNTSVRACRCWSSNQCPQRPDWWCDRSWRKKKLSRKIPVESILQWIFLKTTRNELTATSWKKIERRMLPDIESSIWNLVVFRCSDSTLLAFSVWVVCVFNTKMWVHVFSYRCVWGRGSDLLATCTCRSSVPCAEIKSPGSPRSCLVNYRFSVKKNWVCRESLKDQPKLAEENL